MSRHHPATSVTTPLPFDRFYRATHAQSEAIGGSGLGLSIARSIAAHLHGARISARSNPWTGFDVRRHLRSQEYGVLASM